MKKITKMLGALGVLAPSAAFVAVSCTQKETASQKYLEEMKNDPTVAALKEKFKNYSKAELKILSGKHEATQQSEDLIKAFNQFFGTNLRWIQGGGSGNYETLIDANLTNGKTNGVILFSSEKAIGFSKYNNLLVDTSASEYLENATGQYEDITVGDKHFMPLSEESYGIIYNKDLFAEKGIMVLEGKSFGDSTTYSADGVSLTKPTENYNGTVEKDGKLYVLSGDLTAAGFEVISAKLKDANVQPFYNVSKAEGGNIWPISSHTMNAVLSARLLGSKGIHADKYNEVVADLKEHPENIFTADTVKAFRDVLIDSYKAYNPEYSQLEKGTVDSTVAATNVAIGRAGMFQNGTWMYSQLKQTAKKYKNFGFLPLPIANVDNGKSSIFVAATHRWGATTENNNPQVKELTKLFLQFLYQTQTGIKFLSNEIGSSNPYAASTSVKVESANQLITSVNNYTGANTATWVMTNFPEKFNNANSDYIELIQNLGSQNQGQTLSSLVSIYRKALEDAKTAAAESGK
ncbi:ABC transporter substrate-binding protein [Mycoplasmopsis columboralis]|uniref:Uncharacterized protein n=1 Tax=Mycoplasmopsis columboralis TaxID=171282 RepID=A0A449B6N8_9BACT|nr:ABC transporter substrate-binding protein [Mycoplasmopsis columboralis]VEU76222.1 Uncharacterised protein [Mycoplasmopsis columboralis]